MAIPTELISAVIGAVSGGGVGWLVHRQDAFNSRVQETRRALLELIDLRGQFLDAQGLAPARVEVLGQRREMLLAVATSLAGRASRALTVHDWIALGNECQADRDFAAALKYFERAVHQSSRSQDLLTKVFPLRCLAGFRYESPGAYRNPTEGATLYEKAIELTRGIEDSYMRFHTGLSFANWAWWEGRRHEDTWRAHADEAKRYYGEAAADYPPALDALRQLEQTVRAGFATPVPPRPPDPVVGSAPSGDELSGGSAVRVAPGAEDPQPA